MRRLTEPTFWRDPQSGRAHIGAKYLDGDQGPVAEVYRESSWLHIVTDRYEGHVMLHATALPLLIKELRRLAKAKP